MNPISRSLLPLFINYLKIWVTENESTESWVSFIKDEYMGTKHTQDLMFLHLRWEETSIFKLVHVEF